MLDMHNHHSIGDIRHAVNPTSPYRMQMIVDSAIAASLADKAHGASKESVSEGAFGDGPSRVNGAVGREVTRKTTLLLYFLL